MTEGTRRAPARRLALVNGRVILPFEVAVGKAVVVAGGRIEAVTEVGNLGSGVEQVDVQGRYIAPGLIDIHSHGALRHSFNEPEVEPFEIITGENARRGVTGMLATITTAPLADMVGALAFAREWMGRERPGTRILGVHLEGPYFSPSQKGAQDPDSMRTPADGSSEHFLAFADILRMVTFAPELPGGPDFAARLSALGIVPAGGHSAANDDQVLLAMEHGLRHMIHMWSGQSSTVREGPWRKPGMLEATLVYPGLTAEIIADNRHLPPTLMKLAYKCLGPDRLCAVSDATNGAGLADGARFRLGNFEHEVSGGVAIMLDRSAFAGSTTLLNQMVPILRDVVGIPLIEAIRMVSLTPARVIGFDSSKGSLLAGKDADLAVFEDDFTAWRTMIAGEWIYRRPTEDTVSRAGAATGGV